MPFALLDGPGCLVRQDLLGSEAVYEIVEVDDDLVTAEVVSAPGLPRGKRIRLLPSAVRAMSHAEQPVIVATRAAASTEAPSRPPAGVGVS